MQLTKPIRVKAKKLPGLRRAKTRFRFDKKRDDHAMPFDTAYVFATRSPILDGGDCGVFGCPVGVLVGYSRTVDSEGVQSVVPSSEFVSGRCIEVTQDELARLDAVAELTSDSHRFLAEIKLPQAGHTIQAWVYQALSDATPAELATSATNQPTQAVLS